MNRGPRWTYVCRVEDILPNSGVCAKVGAHQAAVFRVVDAEGDRVYAIDNHDPRSGANVLSRGIVGDLQNEVVVASPVYKQHYSLATGRCLEDETLNVPVYAVRVHEGLVLVQERA